MSEPTIGATGALAGLERAQGRLLSLLENPAIELTSDAVAAASEALGQALAGLCDELEARPGARASLQPRLRHCANNHAVLGTRLERRRQQLARDLGRTRLARRVLDAKTRPEATGGSCDIAG